MGPSSSPVGQPQSSATCSDQLVIIHKATKSKLALVQGLVCLTFFLLMIQFPLTLIRKRYRNNLFNVLAYGAYTAINLLLPYILGLIFNSRKKYMDGVKGINLATFLLIAYMNGTSVHSPYDSLHTESLIIKLLVYLTYILLMLPYITDMASVELLFLILCLIYKIVVWRNLKTIKLDGGKRLNIRCMDPFKYLDDHNDIDGDLSEMSTSDDVLGRCNYVVDPLSIQVKEDKVIDGGTTIQTIWNGKNVLSSLSCNENRIQRLKDTCISFSLLWLLLHKFSGLPSFESSHQEEAWRFVRCGLIDRNNGATFTFEVIEVELAFLSDFLYGNHFELYLPGFLAYLMNQLIFLGAICFNVFIAYIILLYGRSMAYDYLEEDRSEVSRHHKSLMIHETVSCVVVTTITILLFAQAIIHINSRWAKVSLLCNYLNPKPKKCLLRVCNPCIKKAAEILCPIRCEIMKPWQRKLGQYSLVQSCNRRRSPLWKFPSRALILITGNQFARLGRRESKSVILCDDIKKAVIEALKAHGRHLSKGINSLEARGLPQETMRRVLVHTQFEVDAQVILVWHIATSICEIHPHLMLIDRKRDKFHVATSLSKYCAYLAVFAPNLLPGLPVVTDNSCSKVIEEAYTLLKDCEFSNVYQELMKLREDSLEKEGDKRNIIQQGVLLGKLLLDMNLIEDRWEVLADVWSEMILYLAPNSSNEWGHAERLEGSLSRICGPCFSMLGLLIEMAYVARPRIRKSEPSKIDCSSFTCLFDHFVCMFGSFFYILHVL